MTSAGSKPTLAERLERARRASFVGRSDELSLFDAMVGDRDDRAVLFVHGPAGIGKSTLLAECARRAEAARRTVATLDCRQVPATTEAFTQALAHALGQPHAAPIDWPERLVLLIDALENVAGLERWLITRVLPSLPADALVVIAGRHPPDETWRLDAGWALLAHLRRLPALHACDAQGLLEARGITAADATRIVAQAQGHPLLLTLLADAAKNPDVRSSSEPVAPDTSDTAEGADNLLRSLADGLVARAPTAVHVLGLRVLALARSTARALLGDVVGRADAPALYEWLRGLSFVEEGETGLTPHELVREALMATWAARDPDAVEALRRPLMVHLARRCSRAGEAERRRIALDWVWLVRDTPAFRLLDLRRLDGLHVDRVAEADDVAVRAQAASALGAHSEAITAYWLTRQRDGFRAVRRADGAVVGWWLVLDVARFDAADMAIDPIVTRLRERIANEPPLRAGDIAYVLRFVVHDGRCEPPSPTFDLSALESAQWWMTQPRLVFSFLFHPQAERLSPLFESFTRFHWHHLWDELAADIDGRRFGAWVRDWRREPNPLWRLAATPDRVDDRPLDDEAFATAVRDALKHFTRDDRLQASPLLGCDLLSEDRSVAGLRSLLAEAVGSLANHPRDLKFHHALRLTWLDPGATQEQVAAELDLPFNTYRYHLAKGVDRVVQWMWQRELMASGRVDSVAGPFPPPAGRSTAPCGAP